MSIQRVNKLFVCWTISSIVGGVIIGVITGPGDTGHVSPSSTMLIFVVTSAIFGVLGGVAFAPLFTWLEPQLTSMSLRGSVAVALGTLSGLLAIYVVDSIASIAHAFVVGMAVGAFNGLICMVLSVSEYGDHGNTV
jgi:hypothetical protein